MQEVRGSNPLSSTIFVYSFEYKNVKQVTTAPGFRIGAHMDKGRRIGPDDADKHI
jgi:hypothetical protein